MKPTEEHIKKFWKWCGFKIDGVGIWHCPNGISELVGMPRLTLDNLFKWATPKLSRYDGIEFWESTNGWVCHIVLDHGGTNEEAVDTDPAIALFWAIWGVINPNVVATT